MSGLRYGQGFIEPFKNNCDRFVDLIPIDDVKEIIRDAQIWERDGKIGKCLLRDTTEQLILHIGLDRESAMLALWMDRLAGACYKRMAFRSEHPAVAATSLLLDKEAIEVMARNQRRTPEKLTDKTVTQRSDRIRQGLVAVVDRFVKTL